LARQASFHFSYFSLFDAAALDPI